MNIAQGVESGNCNQARDGGGDDVPGVKDGKARSKLFASVEKGKHEESSGVVRGFSNSQEKSNKDQALIVMDKSSAG